MVSSFGMISIFPPHSRDSGVFKENAFERLRCYLSGLGQSVLSQVQQDQTEGAVTIVSGNSTAVCKSHNESRFGDAKDFISCVLTTCEPW